jgi:hypothetical protein
VLDENNLSDMTEKPVHLMFGGLPLVLLSLKQTQLSDVSALMLSNLTKLQRLDLSENKLSHIPDGTFDGLVSLRELYLSKNKLHTIGQQTFGELLRPKMRILRLDSNP